MSGLTKRFGRRVVVDNLSFKVREGEIVGFVGPNRAGKSTAMKMIAGFLVPSVGYTRVCGFDVQDHALSARRLIGYMSERNHCYLNMSVLDFLRFIARVRGLNGIRQRVRISDVLGQLQLESVVGHLVGNLPQDLLRLLGVAQAVLHQPQVLILDGPTDGLDPKQRQHVLDLVRSQPKDQCILISSDFLEDISSSCSRILVLSNGQLRADCTLLELMRYSRYQHAVTLLAEHPLDLLELAVLPGVASIENDLRRPGAITVLANPGQVIYPEITQLISVRGWRIKTLDVEGGRLQDVFSRLTDVYPK